MASLTIRNLEPALKERLRIRAAVGGRSMEAEARRILQIALQDAESVQEINLAEAIHRRFARLGGANDLETQLSLIHI